MNIYFAGSIRGDDSKKEVFKHIVSFLKSKGHDVLTEHVAADNVAEMEKNNSDEFIYNRDVEWLERADVVVAEATGPSFGVGFEVGYAAENNKEVYLLYERGKRVSAMIIGNTHPNITLVPYSDLKELDDFLSKVF